jgi:uncharacterized repeat protein (TIGR01451 family)
VSAGSQLTITFTVTNQGPDLATGIFVSGSVSSGVTFNSATAASGSCSTPVGNAVVCTIPTLQAGSTSSVNFVVTPTGPCNACSATAQVIKINNTNTNITPAIAPFQAGGFSTPTISPSSRTVAAGQIAQYTVQVSPAPVFGANVSLTCSAPPSGAACNFTSSTLTLNGPQSSTLFLTTTPQPVTTVAASTWRGPLYALWLMVPGMTLVGLRMGKKRRSRWLTWLTLPVLFALVLLQPSCSSGNKAPPQVSGTPTGTYSLTVTATSGSLTKSAGFQLTVTP